MTAGPPQSPRSASGKLRQAFSRNLPMPVVDSLSIEHVPRGALARCLSFSRQGARGHHTVFHGTDEFKGICTVRSAAGRSFPTVCLAPTKGQWRTLRQAADPIRPERAPPDREALCEHRPLKPQISLFSWKAPVSISGWAREVADGCFNPNQRAHLLAPLLRPPDLCAINRSPASASLPGAAELSNCPTRFA